MTDRTHTLISERQHRVFWVLVSTILVGSLLYSVFTVATVVNVVERKQAEAQASTLASEVSQLQFSYIQKRNTIDPAQTKRYVQAANVEPVYITRPSLGRSTQVNRF